MKTAKVFSNGRSRAVRMPRDWLGGVDEVALRREGHTVIIEPVRPTMAEEAERVEAFMQQVQIFEFDGMAARSSADVLAELWAKGEPIGDIDTQIAGHAIRLGLPLLTCNTKYFGRVKGLKVLPWS